LFELRINRRKAAGAQGIRQKEITILKARILLFFRGIFSSALYNYAECRPTSIDSAGKPPEELSLLLEFYPKFTAEKTPQQIDVFILMQE
jgi:hypothetical protein